MVLAPLPGGAYETDQFNNRLQQISDSTEVLNEQVNRAIRRAVEKVGHREGERHIVNAIYHDIGGHHWVDKLERWAMRSEDVERLKTPRRDSIYSGHPLWATRVAALFGVGPTIKLNDTLIGSDKIGHFLSQGRKYFRRYRRYEDEARAGEWSAFTERAIFGQMTTGSYSNADLVANYEGYLFYRSLFEDDIISGKPAILRWDEGRWVVQRDFDWSDHVNAYWDEALNVNHYDGLLYPHMKKRLLQFCPDYKTQPAMYRIEDEQALEERYAHLQLRDTAELRLDSLCAESGVADTAPRHADAAR
ncbi:MAG: hypothetical protein R3348_07300 [Xanthomonadales bacterium]|nr:hypothetical protein [Xanthomonadales bacterium]